MNHKRKRPKSTRAGCLMCKPWKMSHSKLSNRERFGIKRKIEAANSQLSE
jgi:hypothetical protein